ncbi:MAG TPA: hypothetical protein VJ454_14450 [Steroidobacteraceae bacterium]|nr:hypothetical protein [Steroidobacteraceae bacterium]
MLLKLSAGLAQPALPALCARDDPLLVKLKLRLRARVRLCARFLVHRLLTLSAIAAQPLLGLREELAPALGCAQLLGQLIATRLTELLILGLVGRLVLSHDLPRELLEIAA